MKMNKNILIFGAGVIAGAIILNAVKKKVKPSTNETNSDAEHFEFAEGGVKLGDKGQEVNKLKTIMNYFYTQNLPINGLFDRQTKETVLGIYAGTSVLNNRRDEAEIDLRHINDMNMILSNLKN